MTAGPGLPLVGLLIAVQAVDGVLLPVLLVFIVRPSSSARIMGEARNRGLTWWLAWGTTRGLGVLAAWLVVPTVLLPVWG